MRKKCSVALGLGLLFVLPAYGASMSAADIMQKVAATYSGLTAYHFVAVNSLSVSGHFVSETEMDLSADGPGTYHLDYRTPRIEVLRIGNGKTSWTYIPEKKCYTVAPVAAFLPKAGEQDRDSGDSDYLIQTQELLISRFIDLAHFSQIVSLEKQDRMKVSGKKRKCYVVRMPTPNGFTELWVDQDDFLVLRVRSIQHVKTRGGGSAMLEENIKMKKAEIGNRQEASYFEFTPPPKAVKVETLGLPGESSRLVGLTAPDISLRTVSGGKFDLNTLRGKVVLIDFWASWCPPCREELPTIAKLYEQLKGTGTVVVGIDDEDSGTIRKFLGKKGYDFPTLVDENDSIHKAYDVRAIPTVLIINRQGVIVDHLVGGRGEKELTTDLKKAGA